jgi:malate dehydrogenase (oxaloacetate-decarboxylating)(NADP+)
MEKTMKDMRNGEDKSGFGGGVEDVYGEDCATEDQLVTPWTVSVAR